MNRAIVQSSNLASVGYDRATLTLEVEFRDGSVYRYTGVPPAVHSELLAAASVGSYFGRNVKTSYPYTRL